MAEAINENNIIKGKVKVMRQLFPTFSNKVDTDFKILSVEPIIIEEGEVETDDFWGTFVIKGNAPEVNMTETYSVALKESYHEKYGKQYEIVYIGTPMDLKDETLQKVFLSKILTENQFNSLYETLNNPFEAIANENIKLLTQCKGIGVKTAIKLIEKYKSTIDYSEAYVKLDGFGLTPRMIEKLVNAYGSPNLAVQKVQQNPYLLATEVEGIGFKKADAIALSSGIPMKSPFRIEAFMISYLKEQAFNGHSYVHPSELFGELFDTLEFERGDIEVEEVIKKTLYNLHDKKTIWYSEDRSKISLMQVYNLEKKVANELLRLLNAKSDLQFSQEDWKDIIANKELEQGWEYTEEQLQGIQTVLENQVVIVTGLAGSGKSSVVSGMLEVCNKTYGYSFGQCALSGRAGARLSEVTGEEGYTIHRLLGYSPFDGFLYNNLNPLPYDIIILDEISMVGLDIFYRLISAIRTGAKLILLGDVSQLESIGLGNLAKDMIDSGVIPVVKLTKIHRQAQKSAIITESLKISKGEQIIKKGFEGKEIRGELQDLELNIYKDRGKLQDSIINQFKEKLTKVDNIMELQVITPLRYRGDISTFNLNKKLQKVYNPYSNSKNEVEISISKDKNYILREGDKVMIVRNNYKVFNTEDEITPVFNGDLGIIREINILEKIMIIEFQRIGDIVIPASNWNDIELAYAITVHKIQGSESDIVIIGMDYSAYTLLSKELSYTAITRAKHYCVLCAETDAFRFSVSTSNVSIKRTFLKDFLLKNIDNEEEK